VNNNHTTNALSKEKSFDEFIKQYERLITKLKSKFNVANYTKDDIEQEIMTTLWNVYNTYDGERSSLTHYIFKSINYRMAYLINYNKATEHYIDDGKYDIDRKNMFKSDENIEKEHEQKELDKKLWDYVATLNYGKTARFYYIGEMNLERIAEIEKVSPQAIHDRLKRIWKQLYEKFGDDIINFIAKP
jgi:RNA polymerase sigma factor (sigma-70 family)